MNVPVKRIPLAGLCYLPRRSVYFALAALLSASLQAAPALAQYYFLPDLPVYWGPYPPKLAYAEPYDAFSQEPYSYAKRFHKRRYSAVSIHSIERELSNQGYHLIAPAKRKGPAYFCVAADTEGHLQRFKFNAFTGKLVTRVAIGTRSNNAPSDKAIPAPPKNPSGSENLITPKSGASIAAPNGDDSSSKAPVLNTQDEKSGTPNSPVAASANPSEPVSSKAPVDDVSAAPSGKI